MPDREKVIKGLECHQIDKDHRINCSDCPYHCDEFMNGLNELHNDALALLKESVPQSVVDQVRWERDTALSQLEQIGKGLGSKMDDIVAMLKEQEAVKPEREHSGSGVTWWNVCGNCKTAINPNDKFCHECGRPVLWEGR